MEAVQDQSDDIRFVAGTTRTQSPEVKDFARVQGLDLRASYDELISSPDIDAVVLSTPHLTHVPQIVAASGVGKHVFCEKPFALTKAEAEKAVEATQEAGVTLGLGYNRRFHPTIADLRERIKTGALGAIMHFEGTVSFPNACTSSPTIGVQGERRRPAAG